MDRLNLEIRFEHAPGHVVMRVAGLYSLKAAHAIADALANESALRSVPRALIDCSELAGDIPDFDRYEIGKRAAHSLAELDRLAVVARAGVRINRFFEDVARNRGLHARVFVDGAEALAWITSP